MILTVYLSDGEQALTEVPITPETTCRDVVEFCKEPGESGCHLAEVWRGNGEYLLVSQRHLARIIIPFRPFPFWARVPFLSLSVSSLLLKCVCH